MYVIHVANPSMKYNSQRYVYDLNTVAKYYLALRILKMILCFSNNKRDDQCLPILSVQLAKTTVTE